MVKGRIDIISMGCAKNLVDSERLIKRLQSKGYKTFHNPESPKGEYVVINTCGFIGDAKEESINIILELGALKHKGEIGQIIVMGCLSERYRNELPDVIPEVDKWYGKFDWTSFIEQLPIRQSALTGFPKDWERTLTTPPWSAYIKISEGCDRYCAYCAIPLITGRHKSRPKEEIIEEVKNFVAEGVKEFNIIAQDLSSYGMDLYGGQRLPELVEALANLEGVHWIRLHYLYPTDFPYGLLDVMAKYPNICRYLDIALQHISDKVLDNMNRHITKQETLSLLKTIKEKVPGIHIRTTIMTGYPGEGEKEFEELIEFVKTQRFERLGGFAYCEEDDTLAAKTLKDEIPEEEKERRLETIMNIQHDISEELNSSKIGNEIEVLVEEIYDSYAVGRSEFDSLEVDQEVIIENCKALPGEFIKCKVTGASPFELKVNQI